MSEEEENVKSGVIEINDVSGITWSHVLCMKPWHFRLMSDLAEKGQPMRFRKIFLVNSSRISFYVWSTLKWILPKEIVDQVRILPTGDDLSTLFEYVPKNLVPEEIGGSWDGNPDLKQTKNELEAMDDKIQNYWNKYRMD